MLPSVLCTEGGQYVVVSGQMASESIEPLCMDILKKTLILTLYVYETHKYRTLFSFII